MMRKPLLAATLAFLGLGLSGGPLQAAGGIEIPHQSWSFSGMFGTFDRAAQQRGLQVYREVCAGCHSLDLIAFRNLSDLGYDVDQIKAIAAEATVIDGPDDDGEMFERAGLASDYFPAPFPNAKAAAASNGGAIPPDLSLMTKARVGGPDYLFALLTGYGEPPADFELLEGLNYNKYFPGHQIAMAQPLDDDAVEYADGTTASLDQMARDLTTFMMWTAEPMLEERKNMGVKVLFFLIIFTAVLYAVKRRVWADLH